MANVRLFGEALLASGASPFTLRMHRVKGYMTAARLSYQKGNLNWQNK